MPRPGRRNLVLGAWGCGVFGNEPFSSAEAFRSALGDRDVSGAFDRVRFAVCDPRGEGTLAAFKSLLACS